MKIMTFDVGGTFIKWAYMNDLDIIEKGKVPTPMTNFEDFLSTLKSVVDSFTDIEGLAFSLPGTIDKKTGYIEQGGALKYNGNRYFKKEVEEFFHVPVSLENDSKSAAVYEHAQGALKGVDHGAVIVIGTGLGCTFVFNGKVYDGAHNCAGEVSILLMGDLFSGEKGIFWAHQASTLAIVKTAQKELNIPDLDGVSFMELVAQGNEKANQVLDTCLNSLAKGIFNIQIINDLERIVIGGGISSNELFMKRLQEKLTQYYEAFPFPIPRANIIKAQGGNDANIQGAAITFYNQYK